MEEKALFLRPPIWLPILVAVLLGGSYIVGKQMDLKAVSPTISITGEGKVSAVPDIASLSFGVQTGRQPTSQAAMEKLQKEMNTIIEAIKAKGIEDKDIRTEYLWLNPAFDWDEGTQISRGYEANQNLQVKIRNMDLVSEVLSAATSAGANQVGGISFTIDDPATLRAEARKLAIEDAKKNGVVLAENLGVNLGALRGFTEGYGGMSPMPYYAERDMGGGGGDLQLPPGEQEIQVAVTLTYEMK